jgi:hypothetical protein
MTYFPEVCILNYAYYMDIGVFLETKDAHILHISCLRVTYEVRKFPAIFFVVVLKIHMVFGSYIKQN